MEHINFYNTKYWNKFSDRTGFPYYNIYFYIEKTDIIIDEWLCCHF